MIDLQLDEWQRAHPGTHEVLKGRFLDDFEALSDRLRARVKLAEARHGLEITANQHVGFVQLGPIRLRIRPKVSTRTLWRLLAYGLELDDLSRLPPADLALDGSFVDLLAAMMLVEAERLWKRGLQRGYVARDEWLTAPRGRPDLRTLVRHLPLTRAALPCHHHAFTADTLPNQLVLGGLRLASHLPGVALRIRASLLDAAQQWSSVCADEPVTQARLEAAEKGRNALTAHYAPAHRLVRALFERSGPDDDLRAGAIRLDGALWNMATLFERAVARYLRENLPRDYHLDTQHVFGQLYSVESGNISKPRPRPDLVVKRRGKPVAVMDTKYKDLSVDSLDREILYQLSVYSLALGHEEPIPAVILYAIPSGVRADARIKLHVSGAVSRMIVLRAVALEELVEPGCIDVSRWFAA